MSSRQPQGPGAPAPAGQVQDSERHSAATAKGLAAISTIATLDDVRRRPGELVTKVAGDVLAKKRDNGDRQQPGHASHSVVQLLERFERCDKELAKLQHQVDMKAERLRREVAGEEGAYQAKVAGLEAQWQAVRGSFQDLEGRMNSVTQAATKIGNRLQNADLYRKRALEGIEKINCLQEFAHAKDPSDLSPLFHDDARLAEAASMTGKLLSVAHELVSSRERVGLAAPKPQANLAPEVGTIENAVEQLELYRNVLDNRVVSRFDAALARQDLPAMADCAHIMAEFSRGEAILVQRYISTRSMFTNLKELQFASQQQQQQAAAVAAAAAASGGGAVASSAVEADSSAADVASLRGLSSLYKSILSTLRDEAVVIEQVFPSPYRALGQYIQRVFEQKVQTAVDAVLTPPPPNAGHAVLRGRLRLMADVYRKTRGLADDLQGLVGEEVWVRDLADMVCADALAAYLPLELCWLQGLYEQRLAAHRACGRGLAMEAVLDMLAMNEEAATRCALLSPAAQLAPAVRQLFHSSTRKQANTGCLLEQVATHILLGLGLAVDASTKALLAPFKPQQLLDQAAAAAAAAAAGPGGSAASGPPPPAAAAAGQQQGAARRPASAAPAAAPPAAVPAAGGAGGMAHQLSRQTVAQAAQLAMANSIGLVLQPVSTIGAIVKLLQQHYQRVLAPHLTDSSSESRACVSGLSALVQAVDERVLGALQRCLTLLLSQADMTLVAEQQRTDFSPSETGPPPNLDAPTAACVAVSALLSAAVDQAEQHLHGPNLASFLAELGRRACLRLDAHMQRFSFSPLGALRWKRDLAEYGALAARLRSPPVRRHLEDMQAHVNMLIVAPDSLLALVDGNLRISHKAALAYIQLRDDFRTARVAGEGGATLAALFSSE